MHGKKKSLDLGSCYTTYKSQREGIKPYLAHPSGVSTNKKISSRTVLQAACFPCQYHPHHLEPASRWLNFPESFVSVPSSLSSAP